jgi:hypothetical protein
MAEDRKGANSEKSKLQGSMLPTDIGENIQT